MALIKSNEVPVSVAAFSMTDIEAAAKRILLRARMQAERILAEAQKEGEILKQQAKSEGFAKGRDEGRIAGHAEGKELAHTQSLAEHGTLMTQLITALSQAVAQFDQSRDDLHTKGINQVVDLSCAIARRVTKRQGISDPGVLIDNLKEAMALVVHAADVRIALHPTQYQTLQQELPHLKMSWPHLKHIELVQDASLSPGGTRIYTVAGQIDGDLDTQLDCVIAEVMAEDSAGGAEGEQCR
jgi:flagellar assembly protein FliH